MKNWKEAFCKKFAYPDRDLIASSSSSSSGGGGGEDDVTSSVTQVLLATTAVTDANDTCSASAAGNGGNSGSSTTHMIVTAIAICSTAYIVWLKVPEWAKPAEWRRYKKPSALNTDSNRTEDDGKASALAAAAAATGEDLASPGQVYEKLMQVISVVNKLCDDIWPDHYSWSYIQAAAAATLHLAAEIRANYPTHREQNFTKRINNTASSNDSKSKGGSIDEDVLSEPVLAELREYLEYAFWAYDKLDVPVKTVLQPAGFSLLRQDLVTEPGKAGHYIAINYSSKILLISVKGTSTMSDVFTDVIATAMEHTLPTPFEAGSDETITIRVHEGMFIAANGLADDLQDLIQTLVLPAGYRVVITGHSLGAGTASLLGLLLRSRIPQLRSDNNLLRVLAFATPPCMNPATALQAQSFITSIVHNYDVVPRLSVSNLLIMNKLMLHILRRLEAHDLAPDDLESVIKLTSDLWEVDEKTLLTPDEIDAFFAKAHAEENVDSPYNLLVPGKVILLFEKASTMPTTAVASSPDSTNSGSAPDFVDPTTTEFGVVVATGSHPMLRRIETSSTMITDHMVRNIRVTLANLGKDSAAATTTTASTSS